MKLKLESVRDISILHVDGPVNPENFAVLRAGIKKLFSTGKNKIILELTDSGTFTTPVLREMAILNLLASELAGQIVLASISPLTRAKIEAFSKPPVVRCFADRNGAIEFFYPKVPDEIVGKLATSGAPETPKAVAAPTSAVAPASTQVPGPAATPVPVQSPAPAPAVTEDQQKQYKQEIRTKELGDLGDTRKRLSELEAENKELKTRITELVIARRDPPDIDSWKEKTAKLEKDLAEAIKVAQDATAAKKP